METAITNNRRKGHIARLPKILRDKVNTLLDDGATYPDIVAELQKSTNPPLPYSINADNIRSWYSGGYQDYLRNCDWNDHLLQRQEKFLDATGNDPVKLADAGMQIAATGLCELLDELSRIDTKDQNASDRYARITNALSRLAKTILTYEHHRQAIAKEKAAELKQRDPNKPFGDESDHLAVVRVIDKVLGLDRFRQKMMEDDAAAGRPWPSQIQSATSNIAPTISTDEPPSSVSEQSRARQQAVTSLNVHIPNTHTATHNQPLETPPAPQPSPAQPQPTATHEQNNSSPPPAEPEPELVDQLTIKRANFDGVIEELPYNWNNLSNEYNERWKKMTREERKQLLEEERKQGLLP